MNPMFNEYKDAGKIQEALLIGRNMVNKAPGDSECVNAYLDFLLMLAEKLPRTDERKSFADQANLVLSFYSISPPTNFCMASRVLSSSISFGSSIGRSARTLIFSSFIVKSPYATFSLVAL